MIRGLRWPSVVAVRPHRSRPLARSAAFACLALLGLTLASSGVAAQDIRVDGDDFLIQFDETDGEKLEDFIDLAKNILLRPMKYSPPEVSEVRIRIVGPQRVRRDRFMQYFQSVLKSYQFIVVPFGEDGAGEFLEIRRLTTGGPQGRNTDAKSAAPIVPVEQLEAYRYDPAALITTSIPLRWVDARSVMATFQGLVDTTIESVRNVENANALVVTGFGQNVWGVYQLAQLIDVPPFKPTPVIHKRELLHASVDELNTVLNELLAAARGLRPGQTQATPQAGSLAMQEIEPRIIPEPRSNALLIAGEQDMIDQIEGWIDVLDVEVEPRGNTHVYRLKNTNAEDVAAVLEQVLTEEQQAQQQARQGSAGVSGGGGAGAGLELRPSAVADRTSNSLIITASDRKYAELIEIIRELDVRPRQVLIEAAIVETANTLNETFQAGVAFGDFDDGAFISNFGTPLGLAAAGGPEGALGGATGGQFAVFSGSDLPIPFFLNVIEANTESNVLSRPYLLTNDNQEASISTQIETSYQTFTTTNQTTNSGFDQVSSGITLEVSPTISAGNYLRLQVIIEVSNFSPASSGIAGAPPDITSRNLQTPVTLPDGHTVVLGGLINENSSSANSRTPWLADLPGIGWMFQADTGSEDNRYLYVFITPHIIDTDFALLDEISAVRRLEYKRLGGDISGLSTELASLGENPDTRSLGSMINSVFDMPTPISPAGGEQGGTLGSPSAKEPDVPRSAPVPIPVVPIQPTPVPVPITPVPAGDPGFDDVFGYDGGR